MLLTKDQRFLRSILRETGFIRIGQILPLMRLYAPEKEPHQCEAILRCLRYAGELVPTGGDAVCLPDLRGREPDEEMLRALDMLLALADRPPLQLTSRRQPYKLCFLLERDGVRIDTFAVFPVAPGREQVACILLAQQPQDVTVLLDLASLEQHRLLHIRQRHYFAVQQDGRFRFFKGGDASQ